MSKLNKNEIGILVIDMQLRPFMDQVSLYRGTQLVEKINQLTSNARSQGISVFFIQHEDNKRYKKGTKGWQLHPDLEVRKEDIIIPKKDPNSFINTNLQTKLEKRGISTLIITGQATHCCIQATAIGGKKLGFSVILIEDGHTMRGLDIQKDIEKWNRKLKNQNIVLKPFNEIVNTLFYQS